VQVTELTRTPKCTLTGIGQPRNGGVRRAGGWCTRCVGWGNVTTTRGTRRLAGLQAGRLAAAGEAQSTDVSHERGSGGRPYSYFVNGAGCWEELPASEIWRSGGNDTSYCTSRGHGSPAGW
jgi:hypothetical protein